ncbi:heterokaryon incompatibility protein-domain-containing protein [Fomes fomentarius]|nr:heterokaryon incompatibility protein-domain-containing protein [Fomes fomentarius]
MRLINTETLKLELFVSPEDVPGGYAILSHCWGTQEQSYQDFQGIHACCTTSGEDPRTYICEKIKRFCDLARGHGYALAWVDTCCIDKTSSAELSEAINSMYRYYSLAALCYAYLHDVPEEYAFEGSQWHWRGWTLQELVAPRVVVFLSASWTVLGTKADLAEQMERCTRVPADVLRCEKLPAAVSIAQRMSWAAGRRTTRVEDEAYCLLGLFDINMPTLYGEGRKAFRRLQEEIMKTSSDTTLFAWWWHGDETMYGLFFAPFPDAFTHATDIEYAPRSNTSLWQKISTRNWAWTRGSEATTFTFLPDLIRARLWTLAYKDGLLADLGWCRVPQGEPVLLTFRQLEPDVRTNRPSSPIYRVDRNPSSHAHFSLSDSETKKMRWRTVLIAQQPSPSLLPSQLTPLIPMSLHWSTPLRISHLASRRIVAAANVDSPWTGSPPTLLNVRIGDDLAVVRIGRCTVSSGAQCSPKEQAIWANVRKPENYADDPDHTCLQDHVIEWPGLTRVFAFVAQPCGPKGIRTKIEMHLRFRQCPWDPSSQTLILDDIYTIDLDDIHIHTKPMPVVHTRRIVPKSSFSSSSSS